MMAMTTSSSMSVKARASRPGEPDCAWMCLRVTVLPFLQSITILSFGIWKLTLAITHSLNRIFLLPSTEFLIIINR